MKGIKCGNCGAPLKLTAADVEKGFATCGYCGTPADLGIETPELDDETRRGLKLLSFVQKMMRAETADMKEPCGRPSDTAIELTTEPGIRFAARIPPRIRFSVIFLPFFTLIWCGFTVFWIYSAIRDGKYDFLVPGAILGLVSLFFLLLTGWSFFGRETIVAECGFLVRTKRIFCLSTTNKYDWKQIDDFRIEVSSRTNNRPNYGLYMIVAKRRKRLASHAAGDDLRWLRTELKAFIEPIKQSQG